MASWRKTKKAAKKAGLSAATMAADEEAEASLSDADATASAEIVPTTSNAGNESVLISEPNVAPAKPSLNLQSLRAKAIRAHTDINAAALLKRTAQQNAPAGNDASFAEAVAAMDALFPKDGMKATNTVSPNRLRGQPFTPPAIAPESVHNNRPDPYAQQPDYTPEKLVGDPEDKDFQAALALARAMGMNPQKTPAKEQTILATIARQEPPPRQVVAAKGFFAAEAVFKHFSDQCRTISSNKLFRTEFNTMTQHLGLILGLSGKTLPELEGTVLDRSLLSDAAQTSVEKVFSKHKEKLQKQYKKSGYISDGKYHNATRGAAFESRLAEVFAECYAETVKHYAKEVEIPKAHEPTITEHASRRLSTPQRWAATVLLATGLGGTYLGTKPVQLNAPDFWKTNARVTDEVPTTDDQRRMGQDILLKVDRLSQNQSGAPSIKMESPATVASGSTAKDPVVVPAPEKASLPVAPIAPIHHEASKAAVTPSAALKTVLPEQPPSHIADTIPEAIPTERSTSAPEITAEASTSPAQEAPVQTSANTIGQNYLQRLIKSGKLRLIPDFLKKEKADLSLFPGGVSSAVDAIEKMKPVLGPAPALTVTPAVDEPTPKIESKEPPTQPVQENPVAVNQPNHTMDTPAYYQGAGKKIQTLGLDQNQEVGVLAKATPQEQAKAVFYGSSGLLSLNLNENQKDGALKPTQTPSFSERFKNGLGGFFRA